MLVLYLVNKYQPDILVTLESDLWWEEQLAVLEVEYSRYSQMSIDNLYGMHVYSNIA
jgi:endonuclease/exonuclease/phosphatase (EEP) superfamily protein YafD